MSTIDWTIVRTAATGGLIIIVPGAFLSGLLFDTGPAALAYLFLFIVFFGFMAAGYAAGRLRQDTPMLHGGVSGFVAFLVAQTFGIIVTIARGNAVSWVTIPLTALLAISFGVAGSLLSDRLYRRNSGVFDAGSPR